MRRLLAFIAAVALGVAVWLLVQVNGSTLGPRVTETLRVGSSEVGSLDFVYSEYVAAVDRTGNLWVIDAAEGDDLWRIDATTNEVEERVPLFVAGGADPYSIAYGEGSFWVGVNMWDETKRSASPSLLRIDPGSGGLLAAIPIGADDITFGAGAVWVTSWVTARTYAPVDPGPEGYDALMRIDPASNRVVATIPIVCPCEVAADESAVWVAGPGYAMRIDPATNRTVAEVDLKTQLHTGDVVLGAGAVWVTVFRLDDLGFSAYLVRIDPATNRIVADIPVPGRSAGGLAFGADSVWIATGQSVARVDPRVNSVISEYRLLTEGQGTGDGVAASDHTVWVWDSLGSYCTVWRIDY